MPRTGDRIDPVQGFRFVSDHQATYPVATQCRVLGVSPSGYYAWPARLPSAKAVQDAALTERIEVIHEGSRKTCGSPRIHAELAAVAHALNTRPRKTLGWRTPAETLDQFLKSIKTVGVATTG